MIGKYFLILKKESLVWSVFKIIKKLAPAPPTYLCSPVAFKAVNVVYCSRFYRHNNTGLQHIIVFLSKRILGDRSISMYPLLHTNIYTRINLPTPLLSDTYIFILWK